MAIAISGYESVTFGERRRVNDRESAANDRIDCRSGWKILIVDTWYFLVRHWLTLGNRD